MKPQDKIIAEPIRVKLSERIAELGQYAAVSYAQRVVSQRETGSFTDTDVELINACNTEHFLMCYQHLCEAHLSRQGLAPVVTMSDYTDTGIPVRQDPTPTIGTLQKGKLRALSLSLRNWRWTRSGPSS